MRKITLVIVTFDSKRSATNHFSKAKRLPNPRRFLFEIFYDFSAQIKGKKGVSLSVFEGKII